jgi:general secretion pathway protein D
VNILSTPHIIATDNVPAEIDIKENIPIQSSVTNSLQIAGLGLGADASNLPISTSGTLPRRDVGLTVKVTPHVSEGNQVRLEIDQESSLAGVALQDDVGSVPVAQRRAQTTVTVRDGQTIVIGGLMRDALRISETKVPLLGDIPILGALFRSSTKIKEKRNLLLVLTPFIVRDEVDLRRIYERKMQERREIEERHIALSSTWEPPVDYQRNNGLLEDIRQTLARRDEQLAEAKMFEANLRARAEAESFSLPTRTSGLSKAGKASTNESSGAAPATAPPGAGRDVRTTRVPRRE